MSRSTHPQQPLNEYPSMSRKRCQRGRSTTRKVYCPKDFWLVTHSRKTGSTVRERDSNPEETYILLELRVKKG